MPGLEMKTCFLTLYYAFKIVQGTNGIFLSNRKSLCVEYSRLDQIIFKFYGRFGWKNNNHGNNGVDRNLLYEFNIHGSRMPLLGLLRQMILSD